MLRKTLQKVPLRSVKPIHTPICVIGGGTASLDFSTKFTRQWGINNHDIRVFEPSPYHYYQPAWTMVGGAIAKKEVSVRETRKLFKKGINFEELAVEKIEPDNNVFYTNNGQAWSYEHLVIAVGIQNKYDEVKGLKSALDDPESPVGCIYDFEYTQKMGRLAKEFRGGKALFTEPVAPIKCGGAPHKITFLCEDLFTKNGVRNITDMEFRKQPAVYFAVPKYADALAKLHAKKNIKATLNTNLIEVKKDERIAIFEDAKTKEKVSIKYDLLHAVPPMGPPRFIQESGLGDNSGFCSVNQFTLQHTKYKNVWSLGDCSNLPTSKTATAIFSEMPVLVKNLLSVYRDKSEPKASYDGYTACPIFTGQNKLMLCEFKYNLEIEETFAMFGIDQAKERYPFYLFKKYFFPFAYWNLVRRGLWNGRKGIAFNLY